MIQTRRLDLVLLEVSDLLALGSPDNRRRLWIDEPAVNPHGVMLDGAAWIQIRVLQVTADPSINPWLVRLMVRREVGEIVGLINFHGPPDTDGRLEIGCEVAPACRRRGFAAEAAVGLAAWAFSQPGVRAIRASVDPSNDASLHVVEVLGFAEVGRHEHPDRGLEIVYELTEDDINRPRRA